MTNNLMSNIMATGTKDRPAEVGMGATMCYYSDRHAATIIKVTPCTITVRQDRAIRTDKLGMSDQQDYRYEPDPNGPVDVFRLTKRGWRSTLTHAYLIIGQRREFYDFSR